MRVGVIGAGAVGGVIASLLARGGHEVEVTARGAHLDAIRAGGIRLTGKWGEYTARVEANETLTHPAELVVVATKAQDTVAAIGENVGLLSTLPLVVVQNGLEGVSAATTTSPKSHVVGGLAMYAASYLSPGQVSVTTPGYTYLGGDNEVAALQAARILSAVMPAGVVANFAGAQWSKLIVNHVNALPAVTGEYVQDVIANHGLRRIMTASMRESVRTAHATGVRFENVQGLTNGRLRAFAAAPLWVGQLLPLLMRRRMGATPNPGSTLQSLKRGQLTEIDYLNGAVVRVAEASGRTAPVNARIVSLVHEVETSGEFIPASRLIELFDV